MRIYVPQQTSKYVLGIGSTIVYFTLLGGVVWYDLFAHNTAVIAVGAAGFFLGLLIYQLHTVRTTAHELALQFAEDAQLFVELYEQSPVPYLRTNKRGEVLDANAAAVRLFGTPEELLHDINVMQAISEEGGDAHIPIQTRLSRATPVTEQEAVLTLPNGTTRWILFSAFPYRRNQEFLMTLIDITQQKNVDIAKTEFVSLASHQLNTPISSIKWNLELLGSIGGENLTEQQHELIAKLERSARRMELIIKDFLDASKLEMGSFAAEFTSFDLVPFVEDLLGEFDARIAKKEIQVQYRRSHEQCPITSDNHLLRMACNNLISNAVKYTPAQGDVHIDLRCTDAAIEFTVTDSGIGIPQAEQSRLFSKFFRADNARKSAEKGTGLGLYITKKAVDLVGGTISVRSAAGEGTSFSITLPRDRA